MKIDKNKLMFGMANSCMNAFDLCENAAISYMTYRRILFGRNCKFATIGKIAKVLNMKAEELVVMTDDGSV